MLNLYVGLDVDPRATSAEIKVAYHRRARETHLDHG